MKGLAQGGQKNRGREREEEWMALPIPGSGPRCGYVGRTRGRRRRRRRRRRIRGKRKRRKGESLAHAVEATKYTAGIPDRSRSRTGGEEERTKGKEGQRKWKKEKKN